MRTLKFGLGLLALSQALWGCSIASGKELKVITQKNIELGDPVSLNPADYLLDVPSAEVLNEIKVESPLKSNPDQYTYNNSSQTVTTTGKEYLSIGTYPLTLDYKGEKYPVTLYVEDTVMPEFVSPAAVVTIPLGTTYFDFSNVYKTKDKDEVKLSVEGHYDLDTVGIYPVTLLAEDASGNSNSLEITINVLGNNRQIKASDQFDYEYVPQEEIKTSTVVTDQDKSSLAPSLSDATDTAPIACSVSKLPQGTEAFYSFSQLYQAGTNWNKLSPNHYFYYLESTDDCGNKVYALTKGISDTIPSPSPSQSPSQAPTDTPDPIPTQPGDPSDLEPNLPSQEPDEQQPSQEENPDLDVNIPLVNADEPSSQQSLEELDPKSDASLKESDSNS